jgi:hypothetical protein
MKHRRLYSAGMVFLIVGLLVVGVLVKAVAGSGGGMARSVQPITTAQDTAVTAVPINGNFSGQVRLDAVATGVYSDTLTLADNQPKLGTIDLALQLSQTDNRVSGYVALEKSLIFTAEHTLAGATPLLIGPYVDGAFDGITLRLQSERVAQTVTGQPMTRQFRVTGTVSADGTTLTGEYRETLWGYAPQPITTIGSFTFKRPDYTGALLVPVATPTPIPPPGQTTGGQSSFLPIVAR